MSTVNKSARPDLQLPTNTKMILYAWRSLDDPGAIKVGEHTTTDTDYVHSTHKYIYDSLGKQKYLWRTGRIEVVQVRDASKHAKQVGRFYLRAHYDNYVRDRIGYNIDKTTEFVRPPCKPEDAVQWVVDRINMIITGARINFPLRSEQQQAVKSIVRYFRNGGTDFLLNAKMRFGKTFTAYCVARMLRANNVLVVTFKPAVRDQWKGELLDHLLFKKFEWISANNFDKHNPITLAKNGKTQVLFASAQDFNDFAKKGKWEKVRNQHFDLVIYDEHHFGAESERSAKALDQLSYTYLLACSGTPIKALLRGTFGPDNTYTWSYVDEQKKRRAEQQKNWKSEVYRWLPKMFIHRMHIPQDVQDRVVAHYPNKDEGLTMVKMFRTTGHRQQATFVDTGTVSHFLDLLAGEVRSQGMNVYRKLQSCSIPLRHTAWFLPSVDAVYAMAKLLRTHPFFKAYTAVPVSSDDYSADGAPQAVRQAITQSNRSAGTITLSFMQMNTGVTVPEWSAVLMLNDMVSAETYFQTIFRCQASWKLGQKEECHVIDFNPTRVVQMAYEYNSILAKRDQDAVSTTKEWLDYATVLDHTENGLTVVDAEKFTELFALEGNYSATFGSSVVINEAAWNDSLLDLLVNLSVTKGKIGINASENGMEKGKNTKQAPKPKPLSPSQKKEARKQWKEKIQGALQQLPLVLVLTEEVEESFGQLLKNAKTALTIPDKWSNFKWAVSQHTLTVGRLLSEHTGITPTGWQQLLDVGVIREDELNKRVMSLNTFIKQSPEKVTERLVTPSALVKKHGVVFTPMPLVNEILDALPKHVWTDKTLKWLEPCVGSGNFAMSIVIRLMDGLKSVIPNEAKRRRHILENMLYMVELMPTNCLLTARRLDPHGDYKLNLSCGDTLKHDFGGMKFDVVVMNPPYLKTLYIKLLMHVYNISKKYLIAIHPSTPYVDKKDKTILFRDLRSCLDNHVSDVYLINGNSVFGINSFLPLVITLVDKTHPFLTIQVHDKINEKTYSCTTLDQVNMFGNSAEYVSLKEKFDLWTRRLGSFDNYFRQKRTGPFKISIARVRGNHTSSPAKMVKDDFYTIVSSDDCIQRRSESSRSSMDFYFDSKLEATNWLSAVKGKCVRFALALYKVGADLNAGALMGIPWFGFKSKVTDTMVRRKLHITDREWSFINKIIPDYYDDN